MMLRLSSLFLLLVFLSGCSADTTPERPNILFIFADDQRTDTIAAWGNDLIETPALDRLAATGMNFRDAHVMGSIHGAVCQPSRAMLMTGRSLYRVYAQLDTVKTFPQQLQEHGYVTFGTGKWHQSQDSFAKSFGIGRHILFGGMSAHDAVPVRQMRDDGTFTDIDSLAWSTDLYADAAIEFMEDHVASGSDDPFLAYVSFQTPHDPRTPKQEYLDLYADRDIPLPDNFMPVHPFHNGWMTGRDEQLARWPRPEADIRDQIREYYGIITQMDARIGDLLDTLDRLDLKDNTVVVYAADNGLAVGSHGLLGKQSLYEHSNRVPVIISGPGIPAGSSDALVYLYDLYPTIAGWTGMPLLEGTDGSDLRGIWERGEDGPRDVLYTVYEDIHRSVRKGPWKLIHYPRLDRQQLFNLVDDPHEMDDRSVDSSLASVREELWILMQEQHAAFDDPHPLTIHPDSLDSDVFDYAKVRRWVDRWQPQWVIDKYFPDLDD
ncbi:MAG: sulfatase-like hydrolase/transferase [Bacteroidota bacterium]|nr:sulfatase-like hydrolase/transferase [Bacteroidota bacterium]